MRFTLRRKKAAAQANQHGAEILLVTHPPDVRYLTGFTGSSAVLLLSPTRSILFTDGRYTTQARAEVKRVRIVIVKRSPLRSACEWLAANAIRKCAFDPDHTSVAALDAMKSAVPAPLRRSLFTPLAALLSRLRELKDPEEIAALQAAADLGCSLFDTVFDAIVPGATETQVALALEAPARLAGASAMSFETIVASGPRSALPHGHATTARLPRSGFLTLDFGVILNGYCSDMTRTVHLGRLLPKERDVYDSVLEAQQTAISVIRPGITSGAVDEAARAVLRRCKLDRFFTHSAGHGVGLEIHEGPRLAAGQTQALEPGMVLTVEPGAYLPGYFGVRIEDMVLVTDSGSQILTSSTTALINLA